MITKVYIGFSNIYNREKNIYNRYKKNLTKSDGALTVVHLIVYIPLSIYLC